MSRSSLHQWKDRVIQPENKYTQSVDLSKPDTKIYICKAREWESVWQLAYTRLSQKMAVIQQHPPRCCAETLVLWPQLLDLPAALTCLWLHGKDESPLILHIWLMRTI